jgi:hypothetical protein
MMGLNRLVDRSDIAELRKNRFDGSHVTKARAGNKRSGVHQGFMSRWKLGPETVAVLEYGFDPVTPTKGHKAYRNRIARHYQHLRQKYNLPEHMALRKAMAQWIQESAGEEESRIQYRAEAYGTHCSSCVCNLTAAQVEKLEQALDQVRVQVFGAG